MNHVIIICVLFGLFWSQGMAEMKPAMTKEDYKNFFPEDLTLVTWDHAVNSKAKLETSLNSTVMMLEADILMGIKFGSNSTKFIPIMAHPPAFISDLSFEDFLEKVLLFNKNQTSVETQKGMKLDIKQFQAVESVLKILQNHGAENFEFPVWLNADILKGPINSTGTPVNGKQFLNLTVTYLHAATLSIGWTTSYGTGNSVGRYTKENIDEMINLIQSENISRLTSITYPVRAGIAAQSISEMNYLIDKSQSNWPNSTLTLWSSADDPVNMTLLHQLISTVGKTRCFTDLPFNLPTLII